MKDMREYHAGANPLRNNSPLNERPEWLSPRDISEVFGIGRTKAYEICSALPHIHIGRSIRVNRRTIRDELMAKGGLG